MSRGRKRQLIPDSAPSQIPPVLYINLEKMIKPLSEEEALSTGAVVYHPAFVPRDRKDLMIHTLKDSFPEGHTTDLDWLNLLIAWHSPKSSDPIRELQNEANTLILTEFVRHRGIEKGFRPVPVKRDLREATLPYVKFWSAVLTCIEKCPGMSSEGFTPMQIFAALFLEGGLCPMSGQGETTKDRFLRDFQGQNKSLEKGANPFFRSHHSAAWRFTEDCRHFANEVFNNNFYEEAWLPMVTARKAISTHIDENAAIFKPDGRGGLKIERRGKHHSQKKLKI